MSANSEIKDQLDDEIGRFQELFPGLDVRFCRIMGRRLSHIAGATSEIRTGELKLPVGSNLLMFVNGSWEDYENDLREYADTLNRLLSFS